jgi:hypothetical protein
VCTVSIVPVDDGFRLACNRDERPTRPLALGVRTVSIDGHEAQFPVDPHGGGTWLAVNDAGVAVALLNRDRSAHAAGLLSRGSIVPRLIAADAVDDVRRLLLTIDVCRHDRFRVVAVDARSLLVATSDGTRLATAVTRLTAPAVFTSSSLGDAEAERVRLPLFRALVIGAVDRMRGQLAFHGHRCRACGPFSVVVRRPEARTVSRSIVDVRGRVTSFLYQPLAAEAA